MNCKQIQELLPLYVGRDLEGKSELMVAAHLQSCLKCFDAAREFRETRQLLREYGSPAISQEVYAEIRWRVLREIQAESIRRSPPQLVASLFRPRLAWALANALIVISALAIYFATNRRDVEPTLVNKFPASVQPIEKPELVQRSGDKEAPFASTPQPGLNDKPTIEIRRFQPRKSRYLITDRSTEVTRDSLHTKLAAPALLPDHDSAASEKTLRMEIQTRDPNIRIIWFAQPNTKPESPGSKGT